MINIFSKSKNIMRPMNFGIPLKLTAHICNIEQYVLLLLAGKLIINRLQQQQHL